MDSDNLKLVTQILSQHWGIQQDSSGSCYSYRVSPEKGIKKLLFGAPQGLNLQSLNLFGFSISVRFVWCII